MGFWIFMLIIDLLIPVTMIGYGRSFWKKAPKEINAVYGYRTSMSMKNRDTWVFAHNYFGKLWFISGMILLPISVIPMLCIIGRTENVVGTVGGVVCFVQMIPLTGVIIPTEIALKRHFDKNGYRRK
ncbi:SdpI family protein [Anaerocolumna chitinilytica]|uniref:SdpI family protein n=1 Tax=Anaerocolumna chitinilytica TaxID=1727145 RepID=A0A7I8DF78_9FIRM|nr:SdpI family protein [Anaerocolumna chitinilytica]BCJ97138.1 hypothetical protein bsdcttw_01790 [Anaerocolumna chitinilytica]